MKTVGFNSFIYFCIPALSYWKIPTVSPRWKSSYVLISSIGKASGSSWTPDLYLTNLTVSFIKVNVFNPRKSIFNNPALSATELSNWVTYKSESLAVVTGTKLVISLGVIMTPQAWIPTLRRFPSRICACWMVSPLKSSAAERLINSFILSKSSGRSTFLISASVSFINRDKLHFGGMSPGINLAILSASKSGKSRTLAVSRIADFAAIVP